jgi:hypothetical protein
MNHQVMGFRASAERTEKKVKPLKGNNFPTFFPKT